MCSSASWRARALITVPNMPMVSDVARSMPAPAPVVPRQMLPPPTITASSRSSSARARAISAAIRSTTEASMVSSEADEAKASPDIFKTMRRRSPTRVPQSPMTTWANRVTSAEPSSEAMVCFSSLM